MPSDDKRGDWESMTFTQKLSAVMQNDIKELFSRYGLVLREVHIDPIEDDKEQLGSTNETVTMRITAMTFECHPDRYKR